jgi:hypothetical protein
MSQTVTTDLDTQERAGQVVSLPVAASVHLYAGTLLALVTSTGLVTFAGDDAGKIVVGRCELETDNTADSTGGALSVPVKRGVFAFQNSSRSSAAYALAAVNVGQLCYVENEQTVQVLAGSTNKIAAGVFLGLDPVSGLAWVDTRVGTEAGSAEALVLTATAVATANATDLPSAEALANAIKTQFNALVADVAALKAAI